MSDREPKFYFGASKVTVTVYKGDPPPADPSWSDAQPVSFEAFYYRGQSCRALYNEDFTGVRVYDQQGRKLYDGPAPTYGQGGC